MTYFTTFYFCVDIFGCSSGAWDWATTCHQRTLVVAIWAAPARRKIPATSNSSTQTHFSNNWRFGSEPPCYCCVTSAFNIKRKIINLSSDFNDDPLLLFYVIWRNFQCPSFDQKSEYPRCETQKCDNIWPVLWILMLNCPQIIWKWRGVGAYKSPTTTDFHDVIETT